MSNFQSVAEFHRVFGHPNPNTLQKTILEDDPKLAKFRLSLIEEEFNELKSAVATNDMTEVIDGLADILYVTYGMGVAFGIDLDRAFQIVHQSNMSKICRTEQEAKDTIEHYKTLPDSPNVQYRPSPDGKYFVVYNEDTGKILKSKYFSLPSFKDMLQ